MKKVTKISTLGPKYTNSDDAAKLFRNNFAPNAEIILCQTAEESFEYLKDNKADVCIVCNLFPDIHKLYIPNLCDITIHSVFVSRAKMGLYHLNNGCENKKVACPTTSTVFVRDDPYEIVIVASNAEAANMCGRGEVEYAVATHKAARELGLEEVNNYGEFAVPYTAFIKKKDIAQNE